MLYLMIFLIDPCNSNADLSKITATGVFLFIFTSVPYSKSNEFEHFFFQNIFLIRMLYAMVLMIGPCILNEGLSKITATDVFRYVFSSVPYSELNNK
jgi:hypothetical protein